MGAPGVLYDEVFVPIAVVDVADRQHGVVQVIDTILAIGVVVVPSSVVVKVIRRRVDADADGSDVGKGVVQRVHVAHGNIDIPGQGRPDLDVGVGEVAESVSVPVPPVRVRSSDAAVLDYPSVGVVVQATVAGVVAKLPRAVHQILLAQLAGYSVP